MSSSFRNPDELVTCAARGDRAAVVQLLTMYRGRLRRMVAIRLDARLSARIDPSDVVQETLIVAHAKLPTYLQDQPVAFYPWLRQIALEQLIQATRRHLKAKGRSVLREEQPEPHLSEASAELLATRLLSKASGPESRLERKETRATLKEALAHLPVDYREVLVLRFLEELSLAEVADVMTTTVAAVRGRQLRALQKLHTLLKHREEIDP